MLKVHDEMREDNLETAGNAARDDVPTLDALAREGARSMLMIAVEEEVNQFLDAHAGARDENGRRLVVRNGHARPRSVTCGAGTMQVRAPRVNDRRVDEDGTRQRFTSRILPPYMRRSPKVAEVLPVLYLRGLSTGDFREALPVLPDEDAAGLSPTNISRLTAAWEREYQSFRTVDRPHASRAAPRPAPRAPLRRPSPRSRSSSRPFRSSLPAPSPTAPR